MRYSVKAVIGRTSGRIATLVCGLMLCLSVCSCHDDPVHDEDEEGLPISTADIFDSQADYIVVLGDLQTMTCTPDYMPYLRATSRWIRRNGGKISCVLQVGDMTETNNTREWQNMADACAIFAERVPYIVTTGNHDYDWLHTKDNYSGISDRNSTQINRYQPLSPARSIMVGQYEPGHVENAVYRLDLTGRTLYLLVLEFAPRREVVEWARSYVDSHSGERFILMTHEFLNADGSLVYRQWSHAYFQFEWIDPGYLAPNELWRDFISTSTNIRALVCGHNGFCRHRVSENAAGHPVTKTMFNLQYQANGGDGMVMIWRIAHGSDTVDVSVYNIITGKFVEDAETAFSFCL